MSEGDDSFAFHEPRSQKVMSVSQVNPEVQSDDSFEKPQSDDSFEDGERGHAHDQAREFRV